LFKEANNCIQKIDESFEKFNIEFDDSQWLYLLDTIFGPNTNLKLSYKKNQVLFKSIASNLTKKGASKYLKQLFEIWKEIPVSKYFNIDAEEEINEETDLNWKDNIKIYIIN